MQMIMQPILLVLICKKTCAFLLRVGAFAVLVVFAHASYAAFPAKVVTGYWDTSHTYHTLGEPQPSIPMAAKELCRVWVHGATGNQLPPGYPYYSDAYYWMGPGWVCQVGWFIPKDRFVWTTVNKCPSGASASNGTCYCNGGYLQNASNDACYVSEVVEQPKVSQASVNSCQGEFGNPIRPLTGAKVDRLDTGVKIGAVDWVLTYDSSRFFTAAALGVPPKSYGDAAAFGPYWFMVNRTQSQVDAGQCKLVCQISMSPGVAACNAVAGGGLFGTAVGQATKAGVCSMVCGNGK